MKINHKKLVSKIKKETGCNHEQAFNLLAEFLELVQSVDQSAFCRGYDQGHKDGGK